ncbi:hypothetical protein B0T19DRAFT_44920 [Cercophora scortea]|uniref:Uncharacterized protein n=1 Tax=Cercophora scortea TaxID=314031 RepID=A0AAE0J5K2_9PEZI|nr:hypothetical protein B0T19DRAFT_44920 [Cercophora scortea]
MGLEGREGFLSRVRDEVLADFPKGSVSSDSSVTKVEPKAHDAEDSLPKIRQAGRILGDEAAHGAAGGGGSASGSDGEKHCQEDWQKGEQRESPCGLRRQRASGKGGERGCELRKTKAKGKRRRKDDDDECELRRQWRWQWRKAQRQRKRRLFGVDLVEKKNEKGRESGRGPRKVYSLILPDFLGGQTRSNSRSYCVYCESPLA